MKLSLNWLKEYVDIKESTEEMALSLTMHAAEVEEIKNQAELLDNVVVGKIKEISDHPNADKLKLVKVDAGEELQIVCGGTNLKQDALVAVGKIGAKVRWHGEGEPVVLEKAKIRGEESFGMICASDEIGLGECEEGEIMILDKGEIGQDLAEALNLDDKVLDIDNKSLTHRSDLFGHLGIAREYAAITRKKLKAPKLKTPKGKNTYKLKVQVQEPELCPRYMAIVLDQVEIKESPDWMQQRLIAIGMRPINNIVDITNYVMLEYAQPLHAFDYHKLFNHEIIVRSAKQGEKITSLDNKAHKLDESMLMICDAQKPVAIAGVMGGANSEIEEKTKTIVLESASFNKASIRKTARKLGLHSESSMRFEKGPGLVLPEQALMRAVELFQKYASAKVASKVHDVCAAKLKEKTIKLDLEKLQQVAGVEISLKEVVNILNALGLKTKKDLKVNIPLFRTDLNIQEDLIEEVTRIYGYDNIKPQALVGTLEPVEPLVELKWADKIREILSGWGFNETMNYSFQSEEPQGEYLELKNPSSEDLKYLRTSLLPGLLKNTELNLNNNFKDLKLFEIGHVYSKPSNEKQVLGFVMTGDQAFFKAKGVLEELLNKLNISKDLGEVELVKENITFVSLDLEEIAKLANTNLKYKKLPKYPPVTIDLSIKIDPKHAWSDIKKEILRTNKLITKIELFDIYKDSKAMHLVFQSLDKTLEMKEVEKFREEIMNKLNKKFNATIRDK